MANEEQILDQGLTDLAQVSRDGYTAIGNAVTAGVGSLIIAIAAAVDRVAALLPPDLTDEISAVNSIKSASQEAATTLTDAVNTAVSDSVAKIDTIAAAPAPAGGTPPDTGSPANAPDDGGAPVDGGAPPDDGLPQG